MVEEFKKFVSLNFEPYETLAQAKKNDFVVCGHRILKLRIVAV